MKELKSCPFCGGEAQQSYAGAKHIIICPNCVKLPADGGYIDPKDAATAWNTRTDNWISVEDKLPDTRTVLGCNIDGYVTAVVYMCYVKKWAIAHNMRVTMDVTHWMPLPEPPKGSE